MNKSTQNKRSHNALAIKRVAQQYGCTERYVRGSINGEYIGFKPDTLRKAYKEMDKAINDAIEKLQNENI